MFSTDLTLNDFVCQIPICQQEADLGSILNIFQHSNSDLLAIPQGDNGWGTVSSQNLLSLLARRWQLECISTVGHPKKQVSQISITSMNTQSFKCIIEPAIIYQIDTKFKEFLENYLQESSLSSNQKKYLIINSAGKLQGKLDTEKLLQYLALKFNQSPRNTYSFPDSSDSLTRVIDSLNLPLKIETAQGKEIYFNKCWQELIASNQNIEHQESQQPDISIAQWWMKIQANKKQQNTFSFSQPNKIQGKKANFLPTDNYQCLSSSFHPLFSWNTSSPEKKINLQFEKLSASSNNNPLIQGDKADFAIQIEQKTEWSYLKIPLTLANEKLREANKSVYWLILATKASLDESPDQQMQNASSATPETIKDKLLATISHELKSPLTGIVGLSSLLKAQKLGKLNQRQTRYIQLIHRSGQQMMGIVNDLLELTSLTTGKLELESEQIDLESLCQQLYQQILAKLQAGVAVETDLDAASSPLQITIESGLEIAIADKSCLSSILSHLIAEIVGLNQPLNNLDSLTAEVSPTVASWRQTEEPLSIRIANLRGWTAIIIGNKLEGNFSDNFSIYPEVVELPSSQDVNTRRSSLKQDASLNLIIAKYLAEIIQGDVLDLSSTNNHQFALLLPKTKTQLVDLAPNSSQEVENIEPAPKNLTILCLYPESEVINPVADSSSLDFNLKKWAEQEWSNTSQQQSNYRHRIIEADGLEQAHTLARIWQLDVIVLDGYQIADPCAYLRSLQKSEYLSTLPLITLDTRTTEAANKIEGLNVYPCLLPAESRSVRDLMQVIQIATNL